MRPRPEGRGELRPASRELAPSRRGFNAATARRPWRTRCRHAASRSRSIGFNAATARRPWRTATGDARTPRRMELQCGHGPKAVENATVQTWHRRQGACFNAATARRPWRTRSRSSSDVPSMHELQCGHGPKAVENASSRARHHDASGQRFNAATARRPWRTSRLVTMQSPPDAQASMRPRPEGRGEPRVIRDVAYAVLRRLQCGHGPKAVENPIGAALGACSLS